jgi:hypothetical protein
MSRTSRKFVVAYILLVGLPLLALAGVLRSGRSLSAPLSVDGTWKIDVDAKSIASNPCTAALLSTPLAISQSGKSLVVSVGESKTESGTIEGTTLTAAFAPGADPVPAGCNSDQSLTLTAVVNPKAQPRSLAGSLSVVGCESCAPVEFRAVRQPRPQGGGAH